jgi:hypothetical protein
VTEKVDKKVWPKVNRLISRDLQNSNKKKVNWEEIKWMEWSTLLTLNINIVDKHII